MRPYLVRYRPPPLSVSVPSALPFSPSLSLFSHVTPLRPCRYVFLVLTTFAPGRIDTRRAGCNDRRPIRSAAIKLYHRLEWRLYFGNLATRYRYKTLYRPIIQKFFDCRRVYLLYFAYVRKIELETRTLIFITRMPRFVRNISHI